MEPTKQDSCLSENTFYAVDTIKIFIDEKYVIVSVVKRLKLDHEMKLKLVSPSFAIVASAATSYFILLHGMSLKRHARTYLP